MNLSRTSRESIARAHQSPRGYAGRVSTVLRHGPGIRPVCVGCGLIRGIGWVGGGHLVQADPVPQDSGRRTDGGWCCSDECAERVSA